MPRFYESNQKCPSLPRPTLAQRSSTQLDPEPCSQASNQKGSKDKRKFISKHKLRLLARKKTFPSPLANLPEKQQFHPNGRKTQASPLQRLSQLSNQRFERFLAQSVDEICCPICKCGIVEGVGTDCGHIFCQECIETSLLVGNRCPMCRSTLFENEEYGVGFSKGVQRIIERVNDKADKPEGIRLKQHQLWKKDRLITQEQILGVGFRLDALSYEGRWRQAKVIEKYMNENNALQELLVEYEDDFIHSKREVIPFFSLRVAPYGFYTQRFHAKEASRLSHFFRNPRGTVGPEQLIPETRGSQVSDQSQMSLSRLSFVQGDANLVGEIQINSIQARDFILFPGSGSISEYSMPDILMVESEELFTPDENLEASEARFHNSSQ